jgi:hypothetical protein
MTLEQYESLTGTAVPDNQVAVVTAQLNRVKAILETMLGYTLTPDNVLTNLYNELGISPVECSCSSVDPENLNPPDEVEYAYRQYRYNFKDKYLFVDPFTAINKVKLVQDNVTIRVLDYDEYRVQYGQDGIAKYIEVCDDCFCTCVCDDCVQLAVDADWVWQDEFPNDLLYIWADMVTYYADCKQNIKSESIGAHSYTKFDDIAPETIPTNMAVLRKYAGPYGSIIVTPTV